MLFDVGDPYSKYTHTRHRSGMVWGWASSTVDIVISTQQHAPIDTLF